MQRKQNRHVSNKVIANLAKVAVRKKLKHKLNQVFTEYLFTKLFVFFNFRVFRIKFK